MALTNNIFLRGALLLLAAGLVVLFGIVSAAITLANRTSGLGTALLIARNDRTMTEHVLLSLLDLETGQRGYLIAGDPTYLQPFEGGRRRLPGELNALARIAARRGLSPQQTALLRATAMANLDELTQTVELARAGHRDQAIAIVRTNHGLALMDNARRLLESLRAAAEQRIAANAKAMIETSARLRFVTEAGGALIMLFGIGALLLAVRYTTALQQATGDLEQLNMSLEDRVAERTRSLSRANDEIQRFAHIVSHDLRAPLVNIMGFTSELEIASETLKTFVTADIRDEKLAAVARIAVMEDIPESVRFIRSSTAKMDNLIKAILRLSREGRRTLTAERIDLTQLARAAAASLQHQADSVGATIDVPGELPVLISDRLTLEQVLSNLLDNALKYLSPERPGHIVVRARDEGRQIVLSVEDNGRGIAKQDHERIFDLFRRAGAQDKPGEGIGLAHVRAIVRRLGGDITVRSRLGEGSEFRVELPKLIPTAS